MANLEELLAKQAQKKVGKIQKLRPDQRARMEAEKAEAETKPAPPEIKKSAGLDAVAPPVDPPVLKVAAQEVPEPVPPPAPVPNAVSRAADSEPEKLKKAKPKLRELPEMPEVKGYIPIPQDLLQWIQFALKLNQGRVYTCLLRYTLGFRRTRCEASHSFISEWTRIKDHKTIKVALNELKELGLIVEAIPHDVKLNRATTYFVPKVEEILSKTLGVETPSGGNYPEGKKPGPQREESPPPLRGELPPKKYNSKESLNKTLSQLVETQVQPSRRERVLSDLEFWKTKFSEEQIIQAFEFIQKSGMIGKPEQKIADPFAYLLTVMDRAVELSAKPAEQGSAVDKSAGWAKIEAEKAAAKEREEQETQETYRAFHETFKDPSEKDQALNKLLALHRARIPFTPEAMPEEALILYWHNIGREIPEVTA